MRGGRPAFPPLRGRPRPSETETPRLPQSSSNGSPPGPLDGRPRPPGRGVPRRGDPGGGPETRLSNPPSVASAPPATRTISCETGPGSRTRGNTPSTRLRGSERRAAVAVHAAGTRGGGAPRRAPPPVRGRHPARGTAGSARVVQEAYLVDPASSICLSQRLSHACLSTNGLYSETAKGSLNQLWFL